MVEFIQNLINNDLISVIVVSLIPMIELKGGIVFARRVGFDFLQAYGLAYLGSTIVFIPIFFLLVPLLNLFKKIKLVNKVATKAELYVQTKANEALESQAKKNKKAMSETFIKQLAVFIFVAIPLPMTGIWMGTAIAVFINLKFKDAVLPIVLGNLVAGLLISGLAELCLVLFSNIKVLDYILYALFGLAVILLVIMIVKIVRQKPTEEKNEGDK